MRHTLLGVQDGETAAERANDTATNGQTSGANGPTPSPAEPEPGEATDAVEVQTTEPEAAAAGPESVAVEPEAAAAEPESAAAEPEVATAEPKVATAEPEVATAEPEALTAGPRLRAAGPDILAEPKAGPGVLAGEPEVLAGEPEVLSAEAQEKAAWRRLAVTGGLVVVLAIVGAAAGATVIPGIAGSAKTTAPAVITNPEPTGSTDPTDFPTQDPTAFPTAEPSENVRPAAAFATWAAPLAGPLGIPQVALEAYGYAEWVLQQTRGTCKLQWTTLAAIGKVTTDHGKQNGSSLDALGRERPALIGPALNGTGGNAKVNDTDGGALDGDQTWDHAIGPMHFIPTMWRSSGVDADGDELADPQNIDDAALSAAYHLCSGGQDLSVAANWKAALSAYHALAARIDKIFEEAQSYGVRSRS